MWGGWGGRGRGDSPYELPQMCEKEEGMTYYTTCCLTSPWLSVWIETISPVRLPRCTSAVMATLVIVVGGQSGSLWNHFDTSLSLKSWHSITFNIPDWNVWFCFVMYCLRTDLKVTVIYCPTQVSLMDGMLGSIHFQLNQLHLVFHRNSLLLADDRKSVLIYLSKGWIVTISWHKFFNIWKFKEDPLPEFIGLKANSFQPWWMGR